MRDLVDWRQADFKKLGIVAVGLAVYLVFALVSSRFAPRPDKLLAAMAGPRCANKKLPSTFVSDPRIVRALGGATLRTVAASPEPYGVPQATGGAYGDGTIGVTTVVRPDAGTLVLAVAQDERDRELGLMCVTQMAPRVGMIFVFGNETTENFWMKDTLIPLDMIFVSGNGRVNGVAANVPSSRIDQPDTTVARRSGRGRYVIELNAGEASKDGIKPGVQLQIPPLLSMD